MRCAMLIDAAAVMPLPRCFSPLLRCIRRLMRRHAAAADDTLLFTLLPRELIAPC